MIKNECAKTVKVNEPYEVWKGTGQLINWEWRVLKKWQADNNKPYARWFCAVKSPCTYDSYDMGDCYVTDIINYARKVEYDGVRW
jgi:hypothetical protein